MKVHLEISEKDLKKLIVAEISRILNYDAAEASVEIMVKSKQNYKAEWERAEFKATYEGEEI